MGEERTSFINPVGLKINSSHPQSMRNEPTNGHQQQRPLPLIVRPGPQQQQMVVYSSQNIPFVPKSESVLPKQPVYQYSTRDGPPGNYFKPTSQYGMPFDHLTGQGYYTVHSPSSMATHSSYQPSGRQSNLMVTSMNGSAGVHYNAPSPGLTRRSPNTCVPSPMVNGEYYNVSPPLPPSNRNRQAVRMVMTPLDSNVAQYNSSLVHRQQTMSVPNRATLLPASMDNVPHIKSMMTKANMMIADMDIKGTKMINNLAGSLQANSIKPNGTGLYDDDREKNVKKLNETLNKSNHPKLYFMVALGFIFGGLIALPIFHPIAQEGEIDFCLGITKKFQPFSLTSYAIHHTFRTGQYFHMALVLLFVLKSSGNILFSFQATQSDTNLWRFLHVFH